MTPLSQAAQEYEEAKRIEEETRAAHDAAVPARDQARSNLIAAFVAEFGPGPFDGGAGGNPVPPSNARPQPAGTGRRS